MDSRAFGRLPSSNLGAKYLDSKQLETNFPDYEALLDRIEDQRQVANFVRQNFGRPDYQKRYPQMYDNVFAILGGRGSGKSSVIQSLWEHLQHDGHSNDIILPIIIPEAISDPHCSILGWIMATVEQVIDNIEEQLRDLEHKRGAVWVYDQMSCDFKDFFRDCHFQHNNRLREEYESLKRDCIPDLVAGSAFSYDDMVGLQVHLSQKQYALVRNLNRFWDDVTEYWKLIQTLQRSEKLNHSCEEPPAQPLIILMFDDVDLVPERSLELLNSTFQYFTNPNIVLILTAAEKVLEQVIWTKMLERMLGSHYESLFTDFYKMESTEEAQGGKLNLGSIDKMAREYYDKVVPPANRYHLRRYLTIADRKRYRYASVGQSFHLPHEEVSIQLDHFLIRQVESLLGIEGDETFICEGGGRIRDAYLLMFGDKSRNIANGCLAILNCVSRLKRCRTIIKDRLDVQQFWSQVYDALQQLLAVLISSNRMVKDLSGDARGLLYRRGNFGEVRVDYDGLWNLYDKQYRALMDLKMANYEQLIEWQEENGPLESIPRSREQEQLGKLQRKIAILLVMLTFVDRLRALVCTWLPNFRDDRGESLAGGRGLAAMLNSNGVMFSDRDDLKYKWSWLTLFPKGLEVEELLLRSPYALEHVEHYAEFDPFDRSKVQEYLMDTFYVATSSHVDSKKGRNSPKERIRQGKCSPEELLTLGISGEHAWVESVLAMLHFQYSGMANVPADILRFSEDSRRVLRQFRFGGYLQQAIKAGLANVLKQDLSSQAALKNYLNEYYKRVIEDHSPALNGIDLVGQIKRDDEEPINSVFTWYHQTYSPTVRARIAEWCVAESIDGSHEKVSQKSFDRWLIQKVEATIRSVSSHLMRESGMLVSLDDCKNLKECLNKIPPISDLSTARNSCSLTLERAEQKLQEKQQGQNALGKASPDKILFPLSTLLEYILLLDKQHAQIRLSQSEIRNYWKEDLIRGYFDLIGMLNPVILLGNGAGFDEFLDNTNHNMIAKIPLNVWIVLMLSMVEHLMPAYFVARLVQPDDREGPRSYYNMSIGQYPLQEEVSQQLKKLYRKLLGNLGNTSLSQMMGKARDRIVELYIEHLESAEDDG